MKMRERIKKRAEEITGEEIDLDEIGAAELRPAPGNRQYVNKKPPGESADEEDDEPNQMMLVSDMILAWDPAFRTHLEMYAEDPTEGELLAKVSNPNPIFNPTPHPSP